MFFWKDTIQTGVDLCNIYASSNKLDLVQKPLWDNKSFQIASKTVLDVKWFQTGF